METKNSMAMAQRKTTSANRFSRLIVCDKEKFNLFSTTEANVKYVVSSDELESVIRSSFNVKDIIVLVELEWAESSGQFYGYEVAKALMNSTHRLTNFNLTFVSILSRDILFELNSGKNRVFTQKFNHYLINPNFRFEDIPVAEISQRKFDYLKNYCLLESGILDRIEHDLRPLLSNPEPSRLQRLISDLKAHSDILTAEVLTLVQKINGPADVGVKEILNQIHRLIQDLQAQFNYPGETANKRSRSTVMLIEDDPETLTRLHTQFSDYFSDIRPFKSGKQAYEELEKNAKEYEVVITDMELLDGNFDDEKLGIDILELCDQKFPFLVTRVITALPKNALSKLIKRTNLGEIIYKSSNSESVIPPFENLVEFVQQIDKEVKKKRLLKSMRGPINSWWGKYLTKELYLVQLNNRTVFDSIWKGAKETAEKFLNGQFDKLSENEKLDAEFKRIKEISNNPESGWEIIELLLAHRLIVMAFAAKNRWEFYYAGDGKDVFTNLPGFKKDITRPSRVYFNTILGFSAEGTAPGWEERLRCSIIPKNFFPEETEWLGTIKEEFLDKLLLESVNEDLYDFIEKLGSTNGIKTNPEETSYEEGIGILKSLVQKARNGTLDGKAKAAMKSVYKLDYEFLPEDLKPEPKQLIEQLKSELY